MKTNIPIKRKVYGKSTYSNIVDTAFKQLIPPAPPLPPIVNVDDFFKAYSDLFYEIPKFGGAGSHEQLIKDSTSYIGFEQNSEDIDALLAEINSLRKELLDANQTIIDLSTKTS